MLQLEVVLENVRVVKSLGDVGSMPMREPRLRLWLWVVPSVGTSLVMSLLFMLFWFIEVVGASLAVCCGGLFVFVWR